MHAFPHTLWYPILTSGELTSRPRRIQRLGLWLILWRDTLGQVHAHPDRCPHLGASFAGASICNGHLVCPFHGFEFDGSGRCQSVPALGQGKPIPSGLQLKVHPVREIHGLIWFWAGEATRAIALPEIPFFDALKPERAGSWVATDWRASLTRVVENQLDVAHLPFVHAATIGRGRDPVVKGPRVEADPDGICLWNVPAPEAGVSGMPLKRAMGHDADRPPDIHYLFPGIWKLHISPRIQLLGVFVPIDHGTTRFYVRTYHGFQWPGIRHLVNLVFAFGNRRILKEDQAVVESVTPVSSMDATEDHFTAADRAIVLFRKRYRALLRSDG